MNQQQIIGEMISLNTSALDRPFDAVSVIEDPSAKICRCSE